MENYKNESMVDVAYSILKDLQREVSFKELYDEVSAKLEFDEETKSEKISKFYTNLSLDGRFVNLKEGNWDLREHHKYDDVHIDMNSFYKDMDDEDKQNHDTEEDDGDNGEDDLSGDEDDVSGQTDEDGLSKEE